jgi:hypothetical protein
LTGLPALPRMVAAFAFAAVVATCGLLPEPGPIIEVATGLTPRMHPDEVTEQAIDRIRRMEEQVGRAVAPARVLRMTATTRAGVGVVWQVTAEGTFTTNRGLSDEPRVAGSGHWVIADADGSVIEFGFP